MMEQTLDKLMRKALLDALVLEGEIISSGDVPFSPSNQHRKQMHHMLKDPRGWNRRKERTVRKGVQWVAAVFAAILIGTSFWLTVDTTARAAFFNWVREVYDDTVIYHFFGVREPEEIQKHSIAVLPQGYQETMRFEESFMHGVFYGSEDDEIILTYQIIDESTQKAFVNSDLAHETVTLENYTADFYVPNDPTQTNELVWVDEESLLIFCISSYLDRDAMIELANSVIQTE